MEQIAFVRPSETLPISLTGAYCALQCAHCGGHYLSGMVPLEKADATGKTSCLISGGCDARGRVPVTAHLPQIAPLRRGRLLNWHVGLIEEVEMQDIAPYVDVISFDWVGDDQTIHEVYGLNCSAKDYARTYAMLRRYTRVVPHLTLGLRGGRFSGEYAALDSIQAAGADSLVLLVLIPTPGTRYAQCQPPPLAEVLDFVHTARLKLPDTSIYLGCMRPRGQYRSQLDTLALRAGVDKIVNPASSAVHLAAELGLSVRWENECCVIQRP